MRFADYYRTEFRADLESVLRAAPPQHHEHPDEATIQPYSLSSANSAVRHMPTERRVRFGAALFFTVLVDQVCYTYFQDVYPKFRSITRYPKLRGDCPGACNYHIHPATIFRALGRQAVPTNEDRFAYDLLPSDTVVAMHREVTDFVHAHMPELGESFWTRCDREIPMEVRVGIHNSSRLDTTT